MHCAMQNPFACLEAVGRRKLMMDNNWKLNEKVSFHSYQDLNGQHTGRKMGP